MNTSSQRRNWGMAFCILAGVGILLRALVYWNTNWTIGDGLITFRFAEQFAAGHGLVFNVGERVGGNTSVLNTFVLGLAAMVGVKIPLAARIYGIICDVGTLFLMRRILARHVGLQTPFFNTAIPLALYLLPPLLIYAVSGMETSLYVFFLFLLIERTLAPRNWVYYAAATLALFCRPDGVVAIAASVLFITLRDRKIHWRMIIGLAGLGLAYAAFNYGYYGSVIPLSVRVKSFIFHNTVCENFHFVAIRFFRSDAALAVHLALLAGLGIKLRKHQALLCFLLMSAAMLVFLLSAPGLRTWYVVPFVYVSGLALAVGIAILTETRFKHWRTWATATSAVVYAAMMFVTGRIILPELHRARAYEKITKEDTGTWLRDNTSPDTTVFVTALEVGWYSKRRTYENPGLVTPKILALLKQRINADLFAQAESMSAEYLVIPMPSSEIPPHFKLLKVFSYEGKLMEWNPIVYGLFQRLP